MNEANRSLLGDHSLGDDLFLSRLTTSLSLKMFKSRLQLTQLSHANFVDGLPRSIDFFVFCKRVCECLQHHMMSFYKPLQSGAVR